MESYLEAALLAERVGYRFVDIKSCHGYLMLSLIHISEPTRPY